MKFAENEKDRDVTSVDRGVVELKTTIERVEQQVEHIQNCITTCVSRSISHTYTNLEYFQSHSTNQSSAPCVAKGDR